MACCGCLSLNEDNARFLLLGIVLICYMVLGALLFQQLESETELRKVEDFWKIYHNFCRFYFPVHENRTEVGNDAGTGSGNNANLEQLHRLLYAFGNATATGIIHKRRRWDFAGSFYFVGTIVSTIGYGHTTPQTTAGKAAVIVYGLLGCSGGILFFNLFLERIITFLAWILRSIHLRRLKKRLKETTFSSRRISKVSRSSLPDILDDEEDIGLEHWKPSVYWVMFSLSLASCVVASIAAAVYAPNEKWTYFEAVYYCFVSFATIGFGDYVATQQESYPNLYIYRISNFCFLVLGCCCIYSLLNVTSIVIKQALNWMILQMQCRCKDDPLSATGKFWRRHSSAFQSRKPKRRRSSIAYPRNTRRIRRHSVLTSWKKVTQQNGETKKEDEIETDSPDCDSDGERRLSGEMISMKDLLKANKVSLAVMQKQLYETAQMQRGGYSAGSDVAVYNLGGGLHVIPNRRTQTGSFIPGTVGPLAILSEKLGDSNPNR